MGPSDEALDQGVEDDRLHEYMFGHPLLWSGDALERREEQDEPHEEDDR